MLTNGYENYRGRKFDSPFSLTLCLENTDLFEETIDMLNDGGFISLDDMLPQPNWPLGHDEKVKHLINKLEEREMTWWSLN